jgi:hypothetical protein
MGLYAFVRAPEDRELARRLSLEWLAQYTNLPAGVESELVDVLADAGEVDPLRQIARLRADQGYADDAHRRNWQAVGLLVDFNATALALGEIPEGEKDLLWHIRHRLHGDWPQSRLTPSVSAQQVGWIIRQFRGLWPEVERPSGVTSGDTNPWDATNFLELLINQMASDPSEAATVELAALSTAPEDGYTAYIRYAADQQRRARREINFLGVTLERLKAVIEDGPPQSAADLLAIIRFALARLQRELRGSDTDTVTKYYCDDGRPRDEDTCTDRLIEDIQHLLAPYGIGRIPQRDMPAGKRADIVFTIGELALPVECKSQWNTTLWTAASAQLDARYLRDWRADDTGLYLVYWYGPNVVDKYRLKAPPTGVPQPSSPVELRTLLIERISAERRGSIAIEVLDLTR